MDFYAGYRYRVSTSLNFQDERTLSHYFNGKRREICSQVQILDPYTICLRKVGQVYELFYPLNASDDVIRDFKPLRLILYELFYDGFSYFIWRSMVYFLLIKSS